MVHIIDTGSARRHSHCIPKSKEGKWGVSENLGFGSVKFDPSRIIVDRRHYDKYFLGESQSNRRLFISSRELRDCYGPPADEQFLGGAFYRFFFEHQDVLESVCEPWFARAQDETHDPFLFLIGTTYVSSDGIEYWIFIHKHPARYVGAKQRLGMGFLAKDTRSAPGHFPSC